MPTLGAALDFAKYEGRNFRAHQANPAPSAPVAGQLYFNNVDNTLWWYDGTTWIAAKSAPDATAAVKGIIQLAGDLTGTAASPQIAAGVITDAEVAAANKDGATGTYSMRTLGGGAQQAMPGNRTLDLIAAPAAAVSLNGKQIQNLADPTGATDGANKQYVDNLASGLDVKLSVRAASTGNLALSAPQTVDGIALIAGDRVLVKDQAAPATNGIYVVAAGAWTRATDADAWAELPSAFVFVEQGSSQSDTGWVCTADAGGTLGTTPVTWAMFSAAGRQSAYYSSATHAGATTWTITQATHQCRASRGLIVQCQVEATGAVVWPDITVAAGGDVTVTFGVAQTANTIRTTILG